jgi:hypothetical protein
MGEEAPQVEPQVGELNGARVDQIVYNSAWDRFLHCLVSCLPSEEGRQIENEKLRTWTTFPCSGNPCCALVDVATLCHFCTGSIFCCKRPPVYDPCCPSLLPPYNIGMGHPTKCCDEPTSCCDYLENDSSEFRRKAAESFKEGNLITHPSQKRYQDSLLENSLNDKQWDQYMAYQKEDRDAISQGRHPRSRSF